ncbi:MAG TPA: hypothetical protein P5523_07880 [Bacteroidales bacterium]|jgi:hypothetical protein|nr:hypothetical protein [Bacteroidales bacterium]
MVKKKKYEKPAHFCRDCAEIISTYNKKPDGVTDIFGICALMPEHKLLDHEYCDKFRQK